MNFTQEQISGLMLDIANSENGTNLLMQLTLNAFMKSERHLHQQENPDDYANGYRERKAKGFGKEIWLGSLVFSSIISIDIGFERTREMNIS